MSAGESLTPNFFAPGVMSHHVALEAGDFERSFYYGLLLQAPLAVLDTAFFIVDDMVAQYRAPVGFPWLQAALKVGAIVPILREGSSFVELVSRLRSDQFVGLTPDAETIALGLDSSGVCGIQRFPPRDAFHMGRSLGEKVQQLFLAREAPLVVSKLPDRTLSKISSFWNRTADWRHQWVDDALNARDYVRDGLRLSDLYLIAARSLDPTGGSAIARESVLDVAKRTLRDRKAVQDVRDLLILMDLLWQQNFRTAMNTAGVEMGLSLPRWHPFVSYLDLGLMPRSEFDSTYLDDQLDVFEALEAKVTIELPRLSALKSTDGNVFESIWKNGAPYRAALNAWRALPTKNNFNFLSEQLGQYSEIIRRAVRSGTPLTAFDIASPETSLLLSLLGGAIATSTVLALNYVNDVSQSVKDTAPLLAPLLPALCLVPSAFRRFRKIKAVIGLDDIVVPSGSREIVLS